MQAARGTQVALRPRLLFAGVALASFALDLVTKTLAVAHLAPDFTDAGDTPVIGSLVRLHLTRNPGAAFSTGTAYTSVLSAVAVVAAAVVLWLLRRVRTAGWAIALGFLMAGILGNLSDRVFREPGPFRGHVVDFIRLPHWPIFNVADVCINVAVLLILIQVFRGVRLDGSRVLDAGPADPADPADGATDPVGEPAGRRGGRPAE